MSLTHIHAFSIKSLPILIIRMCEVKLGSQRRWKFFHFILGGNRSCCYKFSGTSKSPHMKRIVNVSICLSACVHEAAIRSWNGFIKYHIAVINRHFYLNFIQKFDNNNRHFKLSSVCDFRNLKINLCGTY